ncbi:unnamed protein product [Arabidopsis arenosa]|uniref:Uncharacterized protein n=1 Tax=Arabidopsis arenosa TaxID=38785 RepID=A0A8S2AHZ1_ARAAE|nr:unnamed protein product [Arabidopsis arenosa]
MYEVTVARKIDVVEKWIGAMECVHAKKLIRNKLLVGITVQWKIVAFANLLEICVWSKVLIIVL